MTTTESVRPYFVPEDVDFDALPETLRAAITAIINPAYLELVVAAREGLERSTGMTICHLAWLEILQQLELSRQSGLARDVDQSVDHEKLIERHLRLVGAKVKASSLLLRLQEFRRKHGSQSEVSDPLRASTEPSHGTTAPNGEDG